MSKVTIALSLLLLLPPCTFADIESGPKAGEAVREMKVFAVLGPVENKEVDYTKERKDLPTVYLFVQSEHFSRPMARFIKGLDGKITDASDKALSVAVWLGGDAEKHKEYMPRLQMSLKFEKTALTVFTGDKTGPNHWGINSDAHLTAVVVHKGKVVKSFPFISVNDSDVEGVVKELKKAVGK